MAIKTIQRPETWNMELKHGDTWPSESILVEDENGDAITGFTVVCTIKKSITDTTAAKTLTAGGGFSVVGNLITFDTLVDLPVGVYLHDIQVTLSNGKPHTQYEGRIRVTRDI